MNLLGPALVRDLVSLVQRAEADTDLMFLFGHACGTYRAVAQSEPGLTWSGCTQSVLSHSSSAADVLATEATIRLL
jgi:hypothetical protein